MMKFSGGEKHSYKTNVLYFYSGNKNCEDLSALWLVSELSDNYGIKEPSQMDYLGAG